MKRHKGICFLSLVAVLALAGWSHSGALSPWAASLYAQQSGKKFFVFDAHMHPTSSAYRRGGNIGEPGPDPRFTIRTAQQGGLGAAFFNTSVDEYYEVNHIAVKDALRQFDHFYRQIAMYPKDIGVATDAEQVKALQKQGKIAAILAVEGALALEGDLGVLRMFYRLGVREMNLVHLLENSIGDVGFSTKNDRKGSGLTAYGRQLVAEMNRLGIMIDMSHAAEQTILDVIDASTQPVVTTHSGVRALVKANGQWSDAMIRALVKKGGVFCIPFLPMIVGQAYQDKYHAGRPRGSGLVGLNSLVYTGDPSGIYDHVESLYAKADQERGMRAEERRKDLPSISDWIQSVDYVVKLVGADSVGLSTDIGGYPVNLKGIESTADYQNVAQALLQHGYSEADVAKIMGENMLRVFDQVVKTASSR